MRNIQQLKDHLLAVNAECQQIQGAADDARRPLSKDEETKLDELFEEFDRTHAEIGRRERIESLGFVEVSNRRSSPNPIGGDGRMPGAVISGVSRPPVNATIEARAKWADQYFGISALSKGVGREFGTFGEYLWAIANSPHDSRLYRMQAAAGESVGAEGGFLVPSQLRAQILGGVFVESSIVGRVSVVPMASKTIDIAGFNRNNSQTDGAIGGISFTYEPEAGSISEKTPVIGNLTMTAKKAAAWVPVSNELLSDSPFVSRQLADAFTEAARARLELDIINGSGAGQPLGILNAASTIEQTKESGQTAATIVYANIIKMASRLHPSYWGEAVWIASVATMPQLLNLQVKIQNAAASDFVGGSHYLVETDQAGNFSILGRPVLFSAASAALGTVGDLMLVAPSQYALGMRQELTVEASGHERFRNDQTSFRAVMRVDGQSTWASTLTLPGTASTVSWAVKLETRA